MKVIDQDRDLKISGELPDGSFSASSSISAESFGTGKEGRDGVSEGEPRPGRQLIH